MIAPRALSRFESIAPRVLLASMCALAACRDGTTTPNVLLVSVDSLRRDHVSTYGYANPRNPSEPTTPAVDRLAARGIVFEDAASTTSWTLPAHMALLTGLSDPLHGVTHTGCRLDPAFQTLAEALRAEGYATGGFFSGPNLHPVFGFDQGFERYEDCSNVDVAPGALQTPGEAEFRSAHQSSHRAVTSDAVFERSAAWIRECVRDGRPFFAFTHWWDPHYDYRAPPPYDRMYAGPYAGRVQGVHQAEKHAELSPDDVQHLKSLYDGEIRWTDENVGKLFALLAELGVADDTLVVFTSDHGEEFFEHGRWGHQRTLYEEVVRIPLVMSWPARLPAGVRVREPVRIHDIAPTILALCGAAIPGYVDGANLAPTWSSTRGDDASATDGGTPRAGVRDRFQPLSLEVPDLGLQLAGARKPGEKIVWDGVKQTLTRFDLARDPGELAPEVRAESDATMSADPLLLRMFEQRARHRALLPARGAGTAAPLPPGLEAQLKAFGYLGEGEGEGAPAKEGSKPK